MMLIAAGLIAAAPVYYAVQAQADDHAEHTTTTTTETETHSTTTAETSEYVLEDGTKVVAEGDAVFVMGEDGSKTPAPDGDHKTKDGQTLTTKDGHLVK